MYVALFVFVFVRTQTQTQTQGMPVFTLGARRDGRRWTADESALMVAGGSTREDGRPMMQV